MNDLTLHINTLDDQDGWQADWDLGGARAGESVRVAGPDAVAITDLVRRFLEIFERDHRPLTDPQALTAIGQVLFDRWCKPAWAAVEARLGAGQRRLLIRSTDRSVLNLPWELMEPTAGLPIGCDANWWLRRTPLDRLQETDGTLTPGPLRVLFLAAAPKDQAQLDYEKEEDAILRATGRIQDVVILPFAETGTLAELGELVAQYKPHVVHLSGHGRLGDDGRGTFAFEDERGNTDSQDANSIVAEVFRGSSVRCVFLNGCQTAQAAVAGLCQAFVGAGVPLVIGWAASVADDQATHFAEEFYRRLVRGETASVATAHARLAIRQRGLIRHEQAEVQDATFALPQVYTAVPTDDVFDRAAPRQGYEGPRTTRVLLGDGIKGLRDGYIGRRREAQRLIPALRAGEVTFAVITGIGGTGKSTLATRAANRLEADGFHVVPVRVEEGPDPTANGRSAVSKLIDAIDRAFIAENRDDLHAQLTDGKAPLDRRLRLAVDGLNSLRLLLVIDNFEEALDLDTRRITDPELAGFYTFLATNLTHGSVVIVTCRYLPADTPADLPTVLHLPLQEFQEHDFIKFLRREPRVEERMRSPDLPADLLVDLYEKIGGTPGFLDNVRNLLKTIDPNDLIEDLKGIAPGAVTEKRDAYYARILTPRVYAALTPQARNVTCRLATSELPLPVDGVTRIAGVSEAQAQAALDEAVDYGLVQRFEEQDRPDLYHPPGLLRSWLSAPERLPESDARTVHGELAAFWREAFEADRERDLRVPVALELHVCRVHARLGEDSPTFQWATVGLARQLERRAEWRDALGLLDEIAESERDGECWLVMASIEDSLGEWKKARAHLDRALPLLPDNTAMKAAMWHQLATIDLNEGNYAAAREKFGKAMVILQAIGDRAGEAATWHNLATIDVNEGNYAAAREKFGKSLEIKQAIGNRAGEAATWAQLAFINMAEGSYQSARQDYEKAQRVLQAIGDRAGEAATWHNLASIDVSEGNYAAAREKFGKSLEIKQAIGDRAGEAATWAQLAFINVAEGSYQSARQDYEKAQRVLQAIGDRAGEAATWHQLATIGVHEGNYAAAREKFGKAMAIRQAIGDRAGEAATWAQLAFINMAEGSYQSARQNYEKAQRVLQAIGDRAGDAATWHQLATIDLREGNYAAAREKFGKAMAIRQAIGDRAGEAATWYQLGSLAHQMGRGESGARLIAICWMIDQGIGHGDAESDFRNLSALCSQLGYNQQQFDEMLREAAEAYRMDRAQGLLKRAFEGS